MSTGKFLLSFLLHGFGRVVGYLVISYKCTAWRWYVLDVLRGSAVVVFALVK